MVSPARFERATYALGGRRAIQLCHGDKCRAIVAVAFHELNALYMTERNQSSGNGSHESRYACHLAAIWLFSSTITFNTDTTVRRMGTTHPTVISAT